jgi:hypothetical protein
MRVPSALKIGPIDVKMKRFALCAHYQFKGKRASGSLALEENLSRSCTIMSLLINSKKYEISVRVLAGEGDGTLIYLDNHGVVHVVGGGDPLIDREKVLAATKQIEAGAAAFATATEGLRTQRV